MVQTSLEVNNAVRKFKSENVAFCDAFADNLSDGGTQGGRLILLMGQEGRFVFCLLAAKADQESNSLAGETCALADGIDSATFSSSPLIGTRRRKCHAGRLACDIYYKLLANGGH